MKQLIASVINNRDLYLHKDTREKAVSNFKGDVLKVIDSVADFCNPSINWEKLLINNFN